MCFGADWNSSQAIIICTYSSSIASGRARRIAPCSHEVPRCSERTPSNSVIVAGGWPGAEKRGSEDGLSSMVGGAGEVRSYQSRAAAQGTPLAHHAR